MIVYVYRSLKKNSYYLYVAQKNNFERVPEDLLQALGKLEFALEFELSKDRKLATESPQKVQRNLETIGYHLQITDPLLALHVADKMPVSK